MKRKRRWTPGPGETSYLFNSDRQDLGDFYEKSNDVGIEFCKLLTEMRDRTRLAMVRNQAQALW